MKEEKNSDLNVTKNSYSQTMFYTPAIPLKRNREMIKRLTILSYTLWWWLKNWKIERLNIIHDGLNDLLCFLDVNKRLEWLNTSLMNACCAEKRRRILWPKFHLYPVSLMKYKRDIVKQFIILQQNLSIINVWYSLQSKKISWPKIRTYPVSLMEKMTR